MNCCSSSLGGSRVANTGIKSYAVVKRKDDSLFKKVMARLKEDVSCTFGENNVSDYRNMSIRQDVRCKILLIV